MPRLRRIRDVEHPRQEIDAEERAYALQRVRLIRQEILVANRQHALRMARDQDIGRAMRGHPRLRVEQRIEIVNDRAVHRRDLRARIAHDVQEQHVRIQRHQLVGVVHAVERLVHHDARAFALARAQQQLPDDAVGAARRVPKRVEDLDRIERDAGPLDHARRLQADDVGDEPEIRAVVGEIAVQRQQRHEVDDVQRIWRIELRIEIQPQPQRVAAAAPQRNHQHGAGTNGADGRADGRAGCCMRHAMLLQ